MLHDLGVMPTEEATWFDRIFGELPMLRIIRLIGGLNARCAGSTKP